MNKITLEWIRAGLSIVIFVTALIFFGCDSGQEAEVEFDLNENRTRITGILICECVEADIEILVTDENTGTDYISTLTIYQGEKFSEKVPFDSDWISVDISIKAVR